MMMKYYVLFDTYVVLLFLVLCEANTYHFTFHGPREIHCAQRMLMVGCRSDRNLNPSSQTFAQGSCGSLIVMLWLGLCLNYYLVFADACKVCNHKSTLILV